MRSALIANTLRHLRIYRRPLTFAQTRRPSHSSSAAPTVDMAAFERSRLEQVLRARFFYTQAFSIYGGVAGLYDLGPGACALQANIVNEWRRHFVIEEDMLELDTTVLTPYQVLKTSGHVDKFTDLMVKDTVTGDFYRADHLVKNTLEGRLSKGGVLSTVGKKETLEPLSPETVHEYESILAQMDGYNGDDLERFIRKYSIKAVDSGNDVTAPEPFNLMFPTSIGPSGTLKAFLRPETAQGQFVNFNKLLEFNGQSMPFASAQIGKSFRNEISPKSGLLRVREFTMAEIEHYVHAEEKKHPKFKYVAEDVLNILSAPVQESGSSEIAQSTIGDAVAKGTVNNETLGYFMARIQSFLLRIGIKKDRLRFRQHMSNEMAHYASDCWDAEIHTTYGWIECVGCADRSAYDLTAHSIETKENLFVRRSLPEPVTRAVVKLEINRKLFGPAFKKGAKSLEQHLASLSEAELKKLDAELDSKRETLIKLCDGEYKVAREHLSVHEVSETVHVEEYTPHVIEPSFGIGRILYSLLEHSFYTRKEDEQRSVLSFPPLVAPCKVLIAPLSKNVLFTPFIEEISLKLRRLGVANRVDESSTAIGRRYARNDELGTPFGITIDFQTVKDRTVTIRERDTMKQIRLEIDKVFPLVQDLTTGVQCWEDAISQFPLVAAVEELKI